MKIYVGSDFKCHASVPVGSFREIDTDFFDGKCPEFIAGYRYIPAGETWTRADGAVFCGEMVVPWKDFSQLDAAQRAYEREQMADMENALKILLGGKSI